jgi:hypothetical protein
MTRTMLVRLIIAVVLLAIVLWGLSMARDGSFKPSRKPADDFTQNDAFWQSEQ